MKSNRKIIVSALTLFLAAISLAGCAKVARDPETTTAPETTTEEQTTEPTTQAETTKPTSARGAETTRRASGSSNTASKTTEFQVDFDAIRMLGVPKFRAYADLGDGFSSTGKTATVNGVKCKTYKITFEDSDDVLLAYDEQNKVLYEYDNETKDWIEL
jgi:ABC-type phosphate transport system substrate-binding protein